MTALLATGCSSGTPAPDHSSAAPPSSQAAAPPAGAAGGCHRLPAAVLPHSAGSLTQADSGAFCLHPGQRVDVFLAAPEQAAQGGRWRVISSSSPKVLAPVSNGVMSPPLGVTPGLFVGRSSGTSVLSSTYPGGNSWRVTLVVR
ncbi:hypothetical protein [Streptomyces tropicalis]|uniref:Proteinase inhibitor I42 chagasin domain-containing protein n=1 Tax=Streptomyces tropicalis TaxID=3034234 RepID=A0ABT6A4J7_9ACTN|nr:hypothetical protein [Streptomyces tropicalis]MDF3299578.1 hypothetical protein [Streptomyces tropicalis]